MSLDGILQTHNISASEAWEFINVNLATPGLIFAEANKVGLTTDMLAELVGRYDASIGVEEVGQYFVSAGLDPSELSLGSTQAPTPTPTDVVYAGEYDEKGSENDLPDTWEDAPTVQFVNGNGPIIIRGALHDEHDTIDTVNVISDSASWGWLVLDEPTSPKMLFEKTARYLSDDSKAYESRSVEHMGDSQQRAIPLGIDVSNKYDVLEVSPVYKTGEPQEYTMIIGSMSDIREYQDLYLG